MHVWETWQSPGKKGSRWEPTYQSPSGPCYCPKCRNEDAAEDAAEGQEGRSEDWLWKRGKISGAKYIIVIGMNSTLSQRWKGRRELSTGRAGEFWVLTELFHLLRFPMTKLPNIWWALFPFTFHLTPQPHLHVGMSTGARKPDLNRTFMILTDMWVWSLCVCVAPSSHIYDFKQINYFNA